MKSGWSVYRNSRYRYEIQYPPGYALWETGADDQRDGASVRIGRKEYQAPTPILDLRVHPPASGEAFPLLGMQVPGMRVSAEDIILNGQPARMAQYRWVENDDLMIAEIRVRGAVFEFMAAPGKQDLRETEWWQIVSTFRFLEKWE